MPEELSYNPVRRECWATRKLSFVAIRFVARDIRRERTGIHGAVHILYQAAPDDPGAPLAWSNFNLERDEDRVRLANSAHAMLKRIDDIAQKEYGIETLRLDLNRFCAMVWPTILEQAKPELVKGSEAEVIKFWARPLAIEGGGTIIFAPPGKGKSYTLLLLGISIDANIPTLWPIRQTKVLMVNLERSASSYASRIGRVNAALGLERSRALFVHNARGQSLDEIAEILQEFVVKEGIGVVMVDSISRAGIGDLNENRPVRSMVDSLNRICPSWVALGHTPRADDKHIYGGVHFDAGADLMVRLSSQAKGAELGIALQVVKANDLGPVPLQTLALEFGDDGLKGIRLPRRSEFPALLSERVVGLREEIVDYLLQVGEASATQIAEALGRNRSNISSFLSADKAFQGRKEGREVFYQVVGDFEPDFDK